MTIDVGQGLLNAALFLGIPAMISIFVAMYLWERTCRKKIRVMLIKEGGGSENLYPDKEGGEVTISNPAMGVTRTWPINKLTTIPTPYPELGILPRFMQREIQTCILHEGDIEPVLNRSPHRKKVMSPDVLEVLRQIKNLVDNPTVIDMVDDIMDGASTGPSRELIANPSVLGALKVNTVMKALATVSDDLLEALKGIRNQLARFSGLNATYVYIGLGLVIVLLCFNLYYVIQSTQAPSDMSGLIQKVDAIQRALGVVEGG